MIEKPLLCWRGYAFVLCVIPYTILSRESHPLCYKGPSSHFPRDWMGTKNSFSILNKAMSNQKCLCFFFSSNIFLEITLEEKKIDRFIFILVMYQICITYISNVLDLYQIRHVLYFIHFIIYISNVLEYVLIYNSNILDMHLYTIIV